MNYRIDYQLMKCIHPKMRGKNIFDILKRIYTLGFIEIYIKILKKHRYEDINLELYAENYR